MPNKGTAVGRAVMGWAEAGNLPSDLGLKFSFRLIK